MTQPIPIPVDDCSTLKPGELVLCMLDQQSFGITCVLGNERFVAFLSDNAISQTSGPFVKRCESNGITFGAAFSVGYDPNSVVMDATPELGDLIIRKGHLALAAHRAQSQNAWGGKCVVRLDNYEVANSYPTGAVIRRWSIAVRTQHTDVPSEVFKRG